MAVNSSDVGLTVRDLVLEVRADVKEMKEDLVPRVVALETDSIANKKVATALLVERKDVFTKKQKTIGAFFAILTLGLNFFELSGGPHIFQ